MRVREPRSLLDRALESLDREVEPALAQITGAEVRVGERSIAAALARLARGLGRDGDQRQDQQHRKADIAHGLLAPITLSPRRTR